MSLSKRNGRNTASDDGSDSEESALIVWEDDDEGLVDLRRLLMPRDDADGAGSNGRASSRRLPLAMTQQIEELSSATIDSDDEEGGETNAEPMGTADGGGSVRPSDSNESRTPPPPSDPPESKAGGNMNGRLLRLGEVPATVSKLKRRRRRGNDGPSITERRKGPGEPLACLPSTNTAGTTGRARPPSKGRRGRGRRRDRRWSACTTFWACPTTGPPPIHLRDRCPNRRRWRTSTTNCPCRPPPDGRGVRPWAGASCRFTTAGMGGLGLWRGHTHPLMHRP